MASQLREIKEISFGKSLKVIVDGFGFPNPFVRHYFLTHMHSDHTTGLRKTWNQGLIYCSEAAANLLRHDFGLVNHQLIRALPLGETVVVTPSLKVTAISANHSPDAVMFVFDFQDGCLEKRVVHTGDMRWTPGMATGILVEKPIDQLYLDNTYLKAKYTFPTQERVVIAIAEWMRQQLLAEPKTYFAFMTYHIGKERACFGAAEYLNMKVYVTPKKRRILDLLNLPERWTRLMVRDPNAASIRVGGRVNEDEVHEDAKKLGFITGVVIRPTGWSYRKTGPLVSSRVSAHGIIVASAPYSEHSSYDEIRDCVRVLKPRRVIPTVGGAGDLLVEKELIGFMDLTGDKRRIDSYFTSRKAIKVSKEPQSVPGGKVSTKQQSVVDLTVSPSQGGQASVDMAGPTSEEEAKEEMFDLEQVDVAEQRRILDEVVLRCKHQSNNGNQQPGAGGGHATRKRSIFDKLFRNAL